MKPNVADVGNLLKFSRYNTSQIQLYEVYVQIYNFLGILSHYIISDPTKGFTLLVLIYIITIPISPVFYYRLRSKFEKNNKNN